MTGPVSTPEAGPTCLSGKLTGRLPYQDEKENYETG
jgi:hypothetical protein